MVLHPAGWGGAGAYPSTVVADVSEASILPQRVLNSARVMSDVQHVAEASASAELLAGENGLVHLEARSVTRMLVVVCRSHCEWRQTSSPSWVTATSHSTMPAPIAMAATYASCVCSGNIMHAPRWPMETS